MTKKVTVLSQDQIDKIGMKLATVEFPRLWEDMVAVLYVGGAEDICTFGMHHDRYPFDIILRKKMFNPNVTCPTCGGNTEHVKNKTPIPIGVNTGGDETPRSEELN